MSRGWYQYTVEEVGVLTAERFKILVSSGSNLLDEGWSYLQESMFEERLAEAEDYEESSFDVTELKRLLLPGTTGVTLQKLLGAKTRDEIREVVVPGYAVTKRYAIVGIEETSGCQGCVYDAPGQRDHMECPDGCLHMKDMCDFCVESSQSESESATIADSSDDEADGYDSFG